MANCVNPMGLYQPVFGSNGTVLTLNLKKKWQWQFAIPSITAGLVGAEPLPCIKASRPKLNFREMQAEHLNEVIYYPSKPEWQPIQLVLYDRCIQSQNPIFTWLQQQYDPSPFGCSDWKPCIDPLSFKPCANLILYDGCGNMIEGWAIEHCYPSNIDFGELDMGASEVVTMDVTLRYDRAWQYFPTTNHTLYEDSDTQCSACEDSVCMDSSTSASFAQNMFRQNIKNFSSIVPKNQVIEKEPDFVMF